MNPNDNLGPLRPMDYESALDEYLKQSPEKSQDINLVNELKDLCQFLYKVSAGIDERCQICGKKIGVHDVEPSDFNITCFEHRHLRKVFNLEAYIHKYGSLDEVAIGSV